MRPGVAVVSLLLAATVVPAAGQQKPPQPVFRSGVEVVLLDITVLDKAGRPIADLRPQDFSIEVAGKKRPVVGMQYVASGRTASLPASPAGNSPDPVQPSAVGLLAAALATETRSIIVVVDTDNIRAGDGRGAMESLADYFDTMPSTDQIGLEVYPFGKPHVGLTSDRTALRAALRQTVGTSHQLTSCDPTFGEAASGGVGWGSRVGPNCPVSPQQLTMANALYRQQTRRLLDTLSNIATSMMERPGRRAIVLVSEGLYFVEDMRDDLKRLSDVFERARVVLHAVHLDFPFTEASSRGSATLSRRTDDRYGFDAMAETTYAVGGEAIRAISRPTGAIKRIDAALSGTYILGFERIATDKDGKRLDLKVDVSRKGADVRARTYVTINK
jgi:VWFA-related protein